MAQANEDPFPITVLGPVHASYPGLAGAKSMPRSAQETLAVLVARPDGALLDEFARDEHGPPSAGALSMAITRLRGYLPDGTLPTAEAGRYQLLVPRGDVDVWALTDLVDGALGRLTPERLLALIRPGGSFQAIDGIQVVDDARHQVDLMQRLLIERVADERPDLLGRRSHRLLEQHVRADARNERLLEVAVRAIAEHGNRPAALDLIAVGRRALIDVGLDLDPRLQELESRLQTGLDVAPADTPSVDPQLPTVLAHHRNGPYVATDRALERLTELLDSPLPETATITGRTGTGKTRLCAEFANHAIERSVPVVYVTGSRSRPDRPFDAFRNAIPSLASGMHEVDELDDQELRAELLWDAVHDSLANLAASRTPVMIVDDVARLDTPSAAFVEHLVRHRPIPFEVLIVVGPSDSRSGQAWRDELLEALDRRHDVVDIGLTLLDDDAMERLIRSRRVDLDDRQVKGLAADFAILCGGRPDIAELALSNLDSLNLGVDRDGLSPSRVVNSIIDRLSEPARRIGTLAAILGPDFALDTIVALSGSPEDTVLSALNELVQSELIVERSVTSFGVVNLLVELGLTERLLERERLSAHQAAAELLADDPHLAAHHLASAVPLVPIDRATAALLASARTSLSLGLNWEAAGAYRRASALSDGPLESEQDRWFARALDLCGSTAEAERVRASSFDRAIDEGAVTTAIGVATSGLPESEPVDGDSRLVERLERLTEADLGDADRFDVFCHLARQLTIVGRHLDGAPFAQEAVRLAAEADQKARAAVTLRFVNSITHGGEQQLAILEATKPFADELPIARQAELAVLRALDLYEANRPVEAAELISSASTVMTGVSMTRTWHAKLFEAMIGFDRGDAEGAMKARTAAFDHGVRAGISEASNARLYGDFLSCWLGGDLEGLAALASQAQPRANGSTPILGRAGLACATALFGQPDEAVAAAVELAEDVLRTPRSQGAAVLAIVAELLAGSGETALIDATIDHLRPRAGSMLVVGAFAGSLGPVDRYLAKLGNHPNQRLASALDTASAAASPLWQAIVLADLAEAGDRTATDRLRSTIAGTGLEALPRFSS